MNNYVMFAECDVSMVQIEASSDIERLSSEGMVARRLRVSGGLISYRVQSGRWLVRARNRSSRVPALFCTVIYCSASPCINLERLLRYTDAAAAPQRWASNGIVFLFIVRIVPRYRSLEIALYLPKHGVELRGFYSSL